MKKTALALLLFLSTWILPLQADSYRFEKKEDIQKTLKFQDPGKLKDLQLDNIWGSIVLRGYDGKDVRLTAHKAIKARTPERIDRAQKEVTLDITEEGNLIDIYVNGPFRCQEKGRRKDKHDPGYEVHYNFEIKIPRRTNIFIKTVTDGDIDISHVEGEFEVKNVNGKLFMSDVTGSGFAHTVNGEVKVAFSQNPGSDCSFQTINGDIEVEFVKNLSADFWLKTFNGEAFSDFPITYLPASSPKVEKKEGKYVYQSSRTVGVRVGSGGPEIKMNTLNGNIKINKK
jgi:hypothetical protein